MKETRSWKLSAEAELEAWWPGVLGALGPGVLEAWGLEARGPGVLEAWGPGGLEVGHPRGPCWRDTGTGHLVYCRAGIWGAPGDPAPLSLS